MTIWKKKMFSSEKKASYTCKPFFEWIPICTFVTEVAGGRGILTDRRFCDTIMLHSGKQFLNKYDHNKYNKNKYLFWMNTTSGTHFTQHILHLSVQRAFITNKRSCHMDSLTSVLQGRAAALCGWPGGRCTWPSVQSAGCRSRSCSLALCAAPWCASGTLCPLRMTARDTDEGSWGIAHLHNNSR